jgi:hypothetical protein
MIDAAIVSRLSSSSALVALVSTRIYKSVLPEKCTLPAISFHYISALPRETPHDGPLKDRAKYVQISCWGRNPDEMESIAKLAADLFDGYKGTIGGHTIELSSVENEVDVPGVENAQFLKALTLLINYKET